MLEAAAHYARRGWIVHRVQPPSAGVKLSGKKPLDKNWQKVTEPPNEAKLEQVFGNGNPKGYNIGLLCGEGSNITVIDLDRLIYAGIFDGVKTLRSSRTAGRGHVFFKYHPRLKASKHHNLGIEVLATGNNVILPPSVHESGDVYRWDDPSIPIAEMPDSVVVKLNNLFEREKELNRLIKKCRPCFVKIWKKDVRELTDFHGAEGRELMLAWGTDLKAKGATIADGEMWAKIIYGDEYDPAKTLTEWRNIDPAKTWKCETVSDKLGGLIGCDCVTCKWSPLKTSPEKTNVLNALTVSLDKKLDTFDIINALQRETPIIYDSGRQFWVWSKETRMYEHVDEIDVFNALKNTMGISGGTISPARTAYLQAIKMTGREIVVNPPKLSWIAFNGRVIDIENGELFEPSSDYFFTNTIPYKYGEGEETPTIDRLFTEWVGEDHKQMLYEIAAYCLYNHYPIHRAFLLLGSGRNGKGQFINLLEKWLGERNITTSSLELLLSSRFESTKLYQKKACFMGETDYGAMNKTNTFKRLTGDDQIGGEFKGGKHFDFHNYAKLIIATNSVPPSDDKTDGFGSRWVIVDFPNKFEIGKPVIDLIPGWEFENLCRKSVTILQALLERGSFFGEGDIVARAKIYEEKSNPIRKFINERCNVQDDYFIPLWEFYKEYDIYQQANRLRTLTKPAVSNWLRSQGFDLETDSTPKRTWVIIYGLSLKPMMDMMDMMGTPTLYTTQELPSEPTQHHHHPHHNQPIIINSQSDRMKYIDLFFRDHKSKNGEPAEISYASQKQLILFIPEIAKVLHITESVAFKSTMEYGKHRGWI